MMASSSSLKIGISCSCWTFLVFRLMEGLVSECAVLFQGSAYVRSLYLDCSSVESVVWGLTCFSS